MRSAHARVAAIALLAVACGGGSNVFPSVIRDARDVRRPPPRRALGAVAEPGEPPGLLSRAARRSVVPREARLSNGIRVLMAEDHAFPEATVAFVMRQAPTLGSRHVLEGLAVGMRQTPAYDDDDDTTIEAYLWKLGTRPRESFDPEGVSVETTTLPPFVPAVTRKVAKMTLRPKFSERSMEVGREHAEVIEKRLAVSQRRVAWAKAVELALGSDDPTARFYADVDVGGPRTVPRSAIVEAHRALARSDQVTVIATGDFVPATLLSVLETATAGIARSPGQLAVDPPVRHAEPPPRRVVVIDRPGAATSEVVVAFRGARPGEAEAAELAVLADLAGHAFTGSLFAALRVRDRLVYSVHAEEDALGVVTFHALLDAERTAEGTAAMLHALEELAGTPPDVNLLARSKARVVGSYATGSSAHDALLVLARLGLPADTLARRDARVAALTPEQVQAAAARFLDVAHAQVVVVGDAARVAPDLRARELAPAETRR